MEGPQGQAEGIGALSPNSFRFLPSGRFNRPDVLKPALCGFFYVQPSNGTIRPKPPASRPVVMLGVLSGLPLG